MKVTAPIFLTFNSSSTTQYDMGKCNIPFSVKSMRVVSALYQAQTPAVGYAVVTSNIGQEEPVAIVNIDNLNYSPAQDWTIEFPVAKFIKSGYTFNLLGTNGKPFTSTGLDYCVIIAEFIGEDPDSDSDSDSD